MITVLRILLVFVGIFICIVAFNSFARKLLTEFMGLGWGVFGVLVFLMGAIPGLLGWTKALGTVTMILMGIIGICFVIAMFGITIMVSGLSMRNQELAMQVSLLNQENEQILRKLHLLGNDQQEKTETD